MASQRLLERSVSLVHFRGFRIGLDVRLSRTGEKTVRSRNERGRWADCTHHPTPHRRRFAPSMLQPEALPPVVHRALERSHLGFNGSRRGVSKRCRRRRPRCTVVHASGQPRFCRNELHCVCGGAITQQSREGGARRNSGSGEKSLRARAKKRCIRCIVTVVVPVFATLSSALGDDSAETETTTSRIEPIFWHRPKCSHALTALTCPLHFLSFCFFRQSSFDSIVCHFTNPIRLQQSTEDRSARDAHWST